MSYSWIFHHLLTRIDPERAHRLAMRWLHTAQATPGGLAIGRALSPAADPRLAVRLWDLVFPNPLGIAAGLDKDAEATAALLALGYGHVEVGTVTPRAQPGNPRPRIWRLPEQRALINALGFPSCGAELVKHRLQTLHARHRQLIGSGLGIVGVNVGKNRDTELQDAAADYATLVTTLYDVADYFVLNVSSPNTPGLRQLQGGDYLELLLGAASAANREAATSAGGKPRPLLVKLAPDLTDAELEAIAMAAVEGGASGIVATNTTIDRSAVDQRHRQHPGGLSGEPLRERARQVISRLYQTVGNTLPIVGVGGVASAEDVLGHIRAGASLVQLYTGFIYGGPSTARRIVRELTATAEREGWSSVQQLVGRDHRS